MEAPSYRIEREPSFTMRCLSLFSDVSELGTLRLVSHVILSRERVFTRA
jgi:hypothetical protein